MSEHRNFIFWDPSGRRWPRWKQRLLLLGAVLFIGVLLFIRSMTVAAPLRVPEEVTQMKAELQSIAPVGTFTELNPAKPVWMKFRRSPKKPVALVHLDPAAPVRLGYVNGWDPNCYQSLKTHGRALTHVCLESLFVKDLEGNLAVEESEEVEDWVHNHHIALLLGLQNLEGSEWQPQRIESLVLGPPENRRHFIDNILVELEKHYANGLVIDWQRIDPTYRDGCTALIRELAARLHAEHRELWFSVESGPEFEVFDLDAVASVADRLVAVLHDENSELDAPGPIASMDWFEGWLKTVVQYGEPRQWVLAVGCYGYDWTAGEREAEVVSFADVMVRAYRSGTGSIESIDPSYNPHFHYRENNADHTVWFLDAITVSNQMLMAADYGIGGFGLYRMGLEDPDVWRLMFHVPAEPLSREDMEELRTVDLPGMAGNVGKGELIRVEAGPNTGYRNLAVVRRDFIISRYTSFPAPYTVFHHGAEKKNVVTLTFDDGPDPKWTPKILDALKEKNVKATFFIVGRQAERYPDLVHRIVKEGHDIGNHTFFHPNLSNASEEQVDLELNSTQRLLQSITNRSTILFRPPYIADSRPSTESEIQPLFKSQNMGYITVAQEIDPRDYEKPGVEELLRRVREQRPRGNVLLLHDGGGDRSQTIEVLPRIIDYLRERGDLVVPMSDVLNISRDVLMPPLPTRHPSIDLLASEWGFNILRFLEECLWSFMILAAVLVLLRTLVVIALAGWHRRFRRNSFDMDYRPGISLIIAAYNEAKVIRQTLRSLQNNGYPGPLEIIVVDDGSNDGTADVVSEAFSDTPNLHVLRQGNSGKAAALMRGIGQCHNEILVMIDADTQLPRGSLHRLVQPFRDPEIGAVSGQAKVGNTRKWLGRFQALEYICGFNLDRRAYHMLDAITVVPGAIGAYRRGAVKACGGFCNDTLAEDTDLTLTLHRHRYRVAYAGNAIAYTEAPETYRALFKQRFRWAFGTMQCLWKHRDLLFNWDCRWLGCFSLPSIWIFQVFLVATMPLVDAFAIWSLISGTIPDVWIYACAFLLIDLFLALLACLLEGVRLRQCLLIIPMRLLYRPLLALVVWRSIFTALRGIVVGWGKLERTAAPMPHLK